MGAHALTVNADTLAISANVSGTSTLTIQPKTITKTIGLAGAVGDLSLSTAELDFIQNGFSLITIGSATGTGKITSNAIPLKTH